MINVYRKLFDHMEWADAHVLRSMQDATPEQRSRALPLYAHILGAEHVWLSRLLQQAPVIAVWPEMDIVSCARVARENAQGLRSFIATLDETRADEMTSYTNSAGAHFDSSVGDILMQVAMHGSYHRGQISLLLRDGGAEPAPTDYIAFTRGAPAATTRNTTNGVTA